MKHYTYEQAREEVGESTDYKIAKKVSIKKWEEVVKYGEDFYSVTDGCGFCVVYRNKNGTGCLGSYEICPAEKICGANISSKKKLKALKKLKV